MSNLKIKQMVRSSFSTLFFIRENRVRKDGTTIIEVLITVNGERCGFSTGKKVKATSWDKTKQQVKGKAVRKVLAILGWILLTWYVANKCLEKNGRKQ